MMKNSYLLCVGLLGSSLCVQAQSGGALTPPSAPGVSMKSLDQVEPRTPLVDGAAGVSVDAGSGGITISQSGSYYLTGNLSVSTGNAIIVNAAGVALDLAGFNITSSATSASGTAIEINQPNVTVRNGLILSGVDYDSGASGDQFSGSGFSKGIYSALNKNVVIDNITVNGVDFEGISCVSSEGTRIRNCSVNTAGSTGIRAGLVESCNSVNTGGSAIHGAIVKNSYAYSLGGDGIFGTLVEGCTAVTNAGSATARGIDNASQVNNCYAFSSNPAGGNAILSTNVTNSYALCYATGQYAIKASGSVTSCFAYSNEGGGIDAEQVTNSYGRSAGGHGINGDSVNGCTGVTTDTSTSTSHGIYSLRTVSNSFGFADKDGTTSPGAGIYGYAVSNCHGLANSTGLGALGIECRALCQNSYGKSSGGYGIEGRTVIGSYGTSFNRAGINALNQAVNSYGSGTAGIYSSVIKNCYGHGGSASGLVATIVSNSHGRSAERTSPAINATVVSYSIGHHLSGAGTVAIEADIATACVSTSGSINATQKFEGTP